MVVLLAVVGFQVFPRRDVTVLSNGQSYRVSAVFDPRSEALAAASVALGRGDRVLYGTGGRHASVAVQRARPVAVEVDGSVLEVRTQASTVGGALAAAWVDLRPGDRVYLDGQPANSRGPLLSPSFAARSGTNVPSAFLSVAPGDPVTDVLRLSVVRARPVTVFVDTLRLDTSSSAPTVEGLLSELGMTVREVDLVRPGLETPVTAGLTVRLAKARTVNLKIDGKEQTLYTQAQTVADILRILGVDPGPEEILSPPRTSYVTNGMTVVIGLNRTVEEETSESVPPGIVFETDGALPAGTVRVIAGTPGVRTTRYLVTYKNGVETSRVVAAGGGVIQLPTPTRQIAGSRPTGGQRPTLDAPDYTGTYSRRLTVWATWYNATQGGKTRDDPAYGITATGKWLDYGICAVDPTVIPLGSWMYIPKYGKCLAADTGSGVRGNMVDLGFPESAGDHPWGTQQLEIYILD